MSATTTSLDRQRQIRALFDEYIEMYASRDDRLTTHFSENFSGYAGSGNVLVKNRDEWAKITRQDFAQVPGRIRIEMLDLCLQDLSADVVVATAFFHIHLPVAEPILSSEVARLVLIFRLEGADWKIVHSGISIPYQQAQEGEIYPLTSLQERNKALEMLVQERTQELHETQTLYRQLTEDALDVLWKADRNLCITYISPADERLRGFKAEEVIGHPVFELFTEQGVEVVKKVIAQRQAAMQAGTMVEFLTFTAEHRCKDGRVLWGEVLSKTDYDAQGAIVGYHGITRDITQHKLLEDQVRQLAFYDALTNLANRRLMLDHLAHAIESSKRSGHYGALLFLDLDNFKPLNDTHGHGVGDLLLMEVAHRLKACVRKIDTVARFGGDEFVVLFSDQSTDEQEALAQAGKVAENIRASLAAPYWLDVSAMGRSMTMVEHHCSASIGVAVFNGRDAKPDDVIHWADSAMYQAKEDGRNLIRFHGEQAPLVNQSPSA